MPSRTVNPDEGSQSSAASRRELVAADHADPSVRPPISTVAAVWGRSGARGQSDNGPDHLGWRSPRCSLSGGVGAAGVGLAVDLFESFGGYVGVDLGGLEGRVAEDLLDAPQVGTAFE